MMVVEAISGRQRAGSINVGSWRGVTRFDQVWVPLGSPRLRVVALQVKDMTAMSMSDGIDYAAEAELFDYATEAELFSRSGWRKSSRPPLGYKRFARASEAIRFAIEELPPQLLVSTILEVAEKRYQSKEIRFLYESQDYPLARRLRNAE